MISSSPPNSAQPIPSEGANRYSPDRDSTSSKAGSKAPLSGSDAPARQMSSDFDGQSQKKANRESDKKKKSPKTVKASIPSVDSSPSASAAATVLQTKQHDNKKQHLSVCTGSAERRRKRATDITATAAEVLFSFVHPSGSTGG